MAPGRAGCPASRLGFGRWALALYRRYRPETFAEVIGQEHVTEPLMQALRSGRLNHAYLFSGPRGCGKTSSARILARSLNCEQGPTPTPCGSASPAWRWPRRRRRLDVIEIDAASHGGVDDARDLRERAFFAPAKSRYKIYIIDEAHMVSPQGFNALLKLVEEPPEYVKFIFATTEPEKVLGTIRSRTHHYPFRLIPPGVLRPTWRSSAQHEGVAVEPACFPLVVRAGGGSVRDSLSVLDQLIAGAGPRASPTAGGRAARRHRRGADRRDDRRPRRRRRRGGVRDVDRVVEAGHDPRRFAADLLERLRDLIVLAAVPDGARRRADRRARRPARADARPGRPVRRRRPVPCADIVHEGLTEMRGATAPRLLLELSAPGCCCRPPTARAACRAARPDGAAAHRRRRPHLRIPRCRVGLGSSAPDRGSQRDRPGPPATRGHPAGCAGPRARRRGGRGATAGALGRRVPIRRGPVLCRRPVPSRCRLALCRGRRARPRRRRADGACPRRAAAERGTRPSRGRRRQGARRRSVAREAWTPTRCAVPGPTSSTGSAATSG